MKSLLFTDPMVRAILDGRKTMTRRICTVTGEDGPQIPSDLTLCGKGILCAREVQRPKFPPAMALEFRWHHKDASKGRYFYEYSPLKPGETFYVRETWSPCVDGSIKFRASNPSEEVKWRSPLHLSEADARLFLRCADVRVERVQDISYHDAAREGAFLHDPNNPHPAALAFSAWRQLWRSIHSRPGRRWEDNPWVWVCSFEKISKP